jgi:hypothetical protein
MTEEQTETRSSVSRALDGIYDLLTNTRTALALIAAVSVASLLGTLVPQHPGGLEGLREQGVQTGSVVLDAIGLYDVYRSPWFLVLLGLLMGSALLCTIKRTARLLRAQHKPIPRVASLVAHYSLLVVMVGVVVGNVSGLSDTLYLAEGETVAVPGAEFSIRLDRAEERYNADGTVRDWYSYVTVIDSGQEVKTDVIEVNRPLQHKGFALYQSQFGQMPDDTEALPLSPVRLRVTEDGQPVQMISMFDTSQAGEQLDLSFTVSVPNSPKKIEVIVLPGRGLQLWMSRYPTLPDKITLQVLAGETVGMDQDTDVLFADEVDTTTTITVGSLVVSLEDLDPDLGMDRIGEAFEQPVYWSGLLVGKNPGLPLIFTGFAGMALGWAVAFLVPIFRGQD